MHHLFSNNSGKPDSGPDSSVPAIGWPGINSTSFGIKSFNSSKTVNFADPVSVTILPFFKKGAISSIIGLNVDKGVANIIKSAPSTALTKLFSASSTRPLSTALRRVFSVFA
jgi:hypothetical protein